MSQRPRLVVRWSDVDKLGHVNSVVFLTYLEEGRSTWLTHLLGSSFEADQYVVARIELDYRAEIRGGTNHVETEDTIVRVGSSSVTLDEKLHTDTGVTVANGRVGIVMWQPDSMSRARSASANLRS